MTNFQFRIDRAEWQRILLVAATACGLVFWALKLWRADIRILLNYAESPDVSLHLALIKGLFENGWVYVNHHLGAPFSANYVDYPFWDNFHLLVLKTMSLFTTNPQLAENLYYVASYPLTAVSAYLCFRELGTRALAAAVGGMIYAFLPFHTLRCQTHFFLALYFQVPPICLAAIWISQSVPLFRGRKPTGRGWIAIVSACVVGSAGGGPYYGFFGAITLLFGGVIAAVKKRSARALAPALVIAGVVGVVYVLGVLPTILHHLQVSGHDALEIRSSSEAETYGLKLSQLLFPTMGHRLPAFAEWTRGYMQHAPLINENSYAALGIFGAVGFLTLLAGLFTGASPISNRPLFHSLAALTLVLTMVGTVGGFGSIFAYGISPLVRSYNRVSLFIAFFSILATCLVLDRVRAPKLVMLAIGVLALLDVTSDSFVPPYASSLRAYYRDLALVDKIEKSVGPNAAVFQWQATGSRDWDPSSYVPSRPYLCAHDLHWSFGAAGAYKDWQLTIARLPAEQMLPSLVAAGFQGLLVTGRDFAAVEKEIGASPIHRDGEVRFYSLLDYAKHLSAASRSKAADALSFFWGPEFSPLEHLAELNWRWSTSRNAELGLLNTSSRVRHVKLRMDLMSYEAGRHRIELRAPGLRRDLRIGQGGTAVDLALEIPPGESTLRFLTDAPLGKPPADGRRLAFRVQGFSYSFVD